MSYEIVYDRQFIRTPLGIVPLVLSGSNNCTEFSVRGRERRVRSWGVFFNEPVFSEEDLLCRTENCCGKSYQEHFKRNAKWVDDEGFRRFMRNGIASALTLEEIQEINPHLALRCCLDVWGKKDHDHKHELFTWARTTEDLVAWIEQARKRLAERAKDEELYISISFPENEPLKLRTTRQIQGRVVARKGAYYIGAIDEHGSVTQTKDPAAAMIFDSTEDAMNRLPCWIRPRVRFIKAETVEARQNFHFCILIDSSNMFARRLTSRRLMTTFAKSDARRFASEKAAEQYINKYLIPRFPSHTFTACEC